MTLIISDSDKFYEDNNGIKKKKTWDWEKKKNCSNLGHRWPVQRRDIWDLHKEEPHLRYRLRTSQAGKQ